MYQDSICCDNPTEEINCTHTLSINSPELSLSEGGVLTLDLGATAANTAALNGGFAEVTSGTCAEAEAITSAAECEAAAEALGWSDTTVYTGAWSTTFPPGCSNWNSLIFNSGTSTASCTSIKKCTCKTPGLVAAVADNSAAITDNSAAVAANSAALNDGGYKINNLPKCTDAGYGVITSIAECDAAAAAVGWSDATVDSGNILSLSHYPPGCWFTGGVLHYNTLLTATKACGVGIACACKKPGLVAAVADNSAAITANSAALNDPTYSRRHTGYCRRPIQSEQECQTAAESIGYTLPVTVVSWSQARYGCLIKVTGNYGKSELNTVDTEKETYFNTLDTDKACGTDNNPSTNCLCSEPGPVAAVNEGGFVVVRTGTCESHGHQVILNKRDCFTALSLLRPEFDVLHTVGSTGFNNVPWGCVGRSGGSVNNPWRQTSQLTECSDYWFGPCYCKTSMVAAVTANTAKLAALEVRLAALEV